MRAASVQQLNLSIVAQWDELARNREMIVLILKGGEEFEQLDRWDKARMRFFFLARTRRYEVTYFQHQIGNITDQDWENLFEGDNNTAFTSPGIRAAWALIRMRIGPKFRAVVDEIVETENQKALANQKAAPQQPSAKRKARK